MRRAAAALAAAAAAPGALASALVACRVTATGAGHPAASARAPDGRSSRQAAILRVS